MRSRIPERLSFSGSVAEQLLDSDLPVVLTGASGWIGRATLEMLESALGGHAVERVYAFSSTQRHQELRSGNHVSCFPFDRLLGLDIGPHVLLHLAFVTREQVQAASLERYVGVNESISAIVLEHCKKTEVVGMFYPSSGAVYGAAGSLDGNMASNPYGAMKLHDEEVFGAVTRESERTAVIRVFNLAGPYLNKVDHYVLGSILRDLKRGGPIRLNADHPVIRSYTHVKDLVDLAFGIMLGIIDSPGRPFDSAGDREIEVGDLAALSATLMGADNVAIERPPLIDDCPDRYVGDGFMLRELAESCGLLLAPLEQQILETAAYLATQRP